MPFTTRRGEGAENSNLNDKSGKIEDILLNTKCYFYIQIPPGFYLYVESSAPAQAGSRAILESRSWLTAPRGGQCMKFFYTMYGRTMGSLSVVLQQRWGKAATIFSRSGNQGVHWIGAKVSLDIPEGAKFQVI